ncbi:MAG TPA: hypothetical protein VMU80_01770 [Bryobacteraceae bacterium]|nr:hypothetical protein [Bryobacteraceae bacterium]
MKLGPMALVFASLYLPVSVLGQRQPKNEEVVVSAGMDLYRAGGYQDNSGGVPPAVYVFPAKAGRVLAFPEIAGKWTCTSSVALYGPDGDTAIDACNPRANISSPIGPFSGYDLTDFTGGLAGMFLEDSLPTSAPSPLRFYVSDSSQGGIPTDFQILSPLIGQVFFIGDGLTGTGAGTHQQFIVPATATRLYLGYVDSCSASGDARPGCYGDNSGTITVILQLHAAGQN